MTRAVTAQQLHSSVQFTVFDGHDVSGTVTFNSSALLA